MRLGDSENYSDYHTTLFSSAPLDYKGKPNFSPHTNFSVKKKEGTHLQHIIIQKSAIFQVFHNPHLFYIYSIYFFLFLLEEMKKRLC
jgi:hypothetical protein